MQEEKKEYLKQYIIQERNIKTLNQLAKINPEKKKEYFKEIEKSKLLRTRIEEKIFGMEDYILKEVLLQKYIFGKTLEQTALIMNYSKRHIERLHIKALEKFEI